MPKMDWVADVLESGSRLRVCGLVSVCGFVSRLMGQAEARIGFSRFGRGVWAAGIGLEWVGSGSGCGFGSRVGIRLLCSIIRKILGTFLSLR